MTMIKTNKIPTYYLELNENDDEIGLESIKFVPNPANRSEWVRFSNSEDRPVKIDSEKMVVTCPVIMPEFPIYRNDPVKGEYFLKYSKETIFNMAVKLIKEGKANNVAEYHLDDQGVYLNDVIMIESFFVHPDRVASLLFPKAPEGTWIVSFKILNKEYWDNTIMSEEFTGLSLEGAFLTVLDKQIEDVQLQSVLEIINSGNPNNLNSLLLRQEIKNALNI